MKIKGKTYRYRIKKFTKSTAYFTHHGALQFILNMSCNAPFLLNVEFWSFLHFKKGIWLILFCVCWGFCFGLQLHVRLF